MINPFVAIDTLLLDGIAQRIADWVQVRWDRTCFWLVKLGVTLAVGLFALWAILDGIERPMTEGGVAFTGLKIVVVLCCIAFRPTLFRSLDEQEERLLNSGLANPKRHLEIFTRLNMVFMTTACSIVYLRGTDTFYLDNYAFTGFMAVLASVGYFAACTPRPPVREVKYSDRHPGGSAMMGVPDPLVKFDAFLVEQVTEPVVRWIQVRWGKSCFWLEKQTYALSFACFIIWMVLYIIDGGVSSWTGAGIPITASQIVCGVWMWYYGRIMFWQIDRREQKMREGWINEVRFTHVFQRLFALMTTVAMPWFILSYISIGLTELFNILYFVFLVLALYLGACTPLPPVREKKEAPSFGMKTVPQ